MTKMYEKLNSS